MTATEKLRALLDERGVEYEDSELIDHGYRTTTYYTEWGGNDDGDGANVYVEYMDGTVLRMFDATPEQAIAATLGYEPNPDGLPIGLTISNDGNLLDWRGENYVRQFGGTLTAEQVREAVMSADRWEKPMGDTGLTNTHLIIRDDGWQAIADELNAELESDDDYEAKMDALLCRLTNGKWSKSRAYDLDFMVSCVDEEYEKLYEEECATLGRWTCKMEQISECKYDDIACSECGVALWAFSMDKAGEGVIATPNYCPYCGRRVKGGEL